MFPFFGSTKLFTAKLFSNKLQWKAKLQTKCILKHFINSKTFCSSKVVLLLKPYLLKFLK